MIVPGAVETPGQVVIVTAGIFRGRAGVVCGVKDGTNSIRVRLGQRSAYDALRPPEFAWIPVSFLTVRGQYE